MSIDLMKRMSGMEIRSDRSREVSERPQHRFIPRNLPVKAKEFQQGHKQNGYNKEKFNEKIGHSNKNGFQSRNSDKKCQHNGQGDFSNFKRTPPSNRQHISNGGRRDGDSHRSSAGSSDSSPRDGAVPQIRGNVPWLNSRTGQYYIPENFLADQNDDLPLPQYADKYRTVMKNEELTGRALVSTRGVITLRLRDHLVLDMTVDQAIRVINLKNNTILCLSENGSAAALMHHNGRVYQYGSRVEILAHDFNHGNHKYAKMCYKGVSFTSDECALIYQVDDAGTRTATDAFTVMTEDFSIPVFYGTSKYGEQYVDEAMEVVANSHYSRAEDGSEHWILNGVRVTQAADGLLRIAKSANKYLMRTSPQNGTASLSTPFVHTTASLGSTSHLFVRRGDRRMHYDGASFIVRNAGHSAGFDEKNQLKVY